MKFKQSRVVGVALVMLPLYATVLYTAKAGRLEIIVSADV